MSNVTELAEQEAARAEAENPDEPPPVEPPGEPAPDEEEEADAQEPEPEPEPEVNSDAQAKAVVSELRRHERAWAKLNGVEPEDLNVCPTCEGVGFTMEPQPQVKESTYTERCTDCNGYGEVISGSVKEGSQTVRCLTCTGLGYVDTRTGAELTGNGMVEATIEPPIEDDSRAAELRALGYTVFKSPSVNVAAP